MQHIRTNKVKMGSNFTRFCSTKPSFLQLMGNLVFIISATLSIPLVICATDFLIHYPRSESDDTQKLKSKLISIEERVKILERNNQ